MCASFQCLCIWETTLNFLVAQHLSVSSVKAQGCTPAVFYMKARLASSEPCYFSEKATDWIRILSSSCHRKSKGLWKRVGSFKKSLMVYIAPSPADMMEWRNRKTGTKSFWEWKGDRGYSSLDPALHCFTIATVSLLKCQHFWLKTLKVGEKPDFSPI